jgi:regulatory protein
VDAELEAARTWARKHRIGPWRTGPVDPEIRRKELARMARNGFGYGVACKVVDEPAP